MSAKSIPEPLLWSLYLLTASIAFKLFNQLNTDYDLWFHLFVGREMFSSGVIGRYDAYSFTANGLPVINHEWLADLIMTAFFKLDQSIGLILWRWTMVLGIIFQCLNLIKARTQNRLVQIIVFLVFAVVISKGIAFRVHLFSYLFLLILLNMIYKARTKGQLPSVLSVSVLFLFWANIHGAFILGLLVWAVYFACDGFGFSEKRCTGVRHPKWHGLWVLLTPFIITLINPFGIGLWKFLMHELTNPVSGKYITEWQRFSFAPREFSFLLVFLCTWVMFFYNPKQRAAAETAMLMLASVMGFAAVRHTPLFVILALPGLAYHANGALATLLEKQRDQKPAPKSLVALFAVFFSAVSAVFFYAGSPAKWSIQVNAEPLPYQSVAFIKANRLKGNLWVPLHWGGYALFHLYPDIKVSIDGRWAMLYPQQVMSDAMTFAYQGGGGRWRELLDYYNADFALIERENFAVAEMNKDPAWVWGFKETDCALLVKRTTFDRLKANLHIPRYSPPSWP
jgi:hypothetical protein